ncbi:hypothetical protein VP277E431_P0066 [Vibrio phage 277E43-1]|nr:hypothetical protein VP277E431_P0066 [Vibrio phage 277E43-1]
MAATDFETAVDQSITASNQLHDVVNGSSTETVTTESGEIPSVRKALTDSMMYLPSIPWVQGEDEINLFQPRIFGDQIYWAPNATSVNPTPMGTSPVGDNNWFLAPVSLNENFVREVSADTFNYDGLTYKGVGNISDFAGQPLQETDKTNAYQYPDNSRKFYAANKSQVFPITIPADPSSDNEWALVNALTSESLSLYTNTTYKASGGNSAVENMVAGNPISINVGSTCQCENGTIFLRAGNATGGLSDFDAINHINVKDFGAYGGDLPCHDEINNAVAYAVDGEFSIYIPSGRYVIGEPIIAKGRVSIFGDGVNSKLDGSNCSRVADSEYYDGVRAGVISTNSVSFVEISNLSIEYNSKNSSGTVNGVEFCGSRNCSVKDCLILAEVNDNNVSAVRAIDGKDKMGNRVGCANISVTGNQIFCPGIAFLAQSGGSIYGEDFSFSNNFVKVNQTTGPGTVTTGVIKIDLYTKNVSLVGNVCNGNGITKAFIQCEENVENVSISGNSIRDCDIAGIKLFDGQSAQRFKNITIDGNSLLGCGIDIGHGGAPSPDSEGIIVSNNNISEYSGSGVPDEASIWVNFLALADGLVIAGNNITGGSEGGISVRTDNAVISNNFIKNSKKKGILLRDAGKSVVSGNRVVDCEDRSIVFNNSPDSVLSGNVITSKLSNGVGLVSWIGSSTGGASITGNTFDTVDTYSILNQNLTFKNTISGNRFISGGVFDRNSDIIGLNDGIDNHPTWGADPNGSITTGYIGQELLRTDNNTWYKSFATGDSSWRQIG